MRVVGYEVTETLVLKQRPADDGAALARRLAQASLLANDVQILSTRLPASQFAVGDAQSAVNLLATSPAFGTGPIWGRISLLTDVDPTRNSLDTLVVTATVEIGGSLDLRPVLAPPPATTPLAFISGSWRSRSTGLRGTFRGVFVIPFQLPGLEGYWYLRPDNVGIDAGCLAGDSPIPGLCPLTTGETLLGIPLTKIVVEFAAEN